MNKNDKLICCNGVDKPIITNCRDKPSYIKVHWIKTYKNRIKIPRDILDKILKSFHE